MSHIRHLVFFNIKSPNDLPEGIGAGFQPGSAFTGRSLRNRPIMKKPCKAGFG